MVNLSVSPYLARMKPSNAFRLTIMPFTVAATLLDRALLDRQRKRGSWSCIWRTLYSRLGPFDNLMRTCIMNFVIPLYLASVASSLFIMLSRPDEYSGSPQPLHYRLEVVIISTGGVGKLDMIEEVLKLDYVVGSWDK